MEDEAGRESLALHTRARARIAAFERGEVPAESFDDLARDLARFQMRHVPGYARLCRARAVHGADVRGAGDAPAVPTDAFKLSSVFAFDPSRATTAFRTSGTSVGVRGLHLMRDVGTYDAAALAFGRAMLLSSGTERVTVLVIGPSPAEAPDSSLTHMCALFAGTFGERAPAGQTFFVRGGALRVEELRARVASLDAAIPALVLATSFALVHLIDALGPDRLPLPLRSRVMQTGGYKGRSREVAPEELRAGVARVFAVGERAVVGEYGMTELSSQFWEATWAQGDVPPGVFLEPPWARVVPVDPESLRPLPEGQIGLARIEDLANVDSAFAVVTQDRVRRAHGGFELLGRAPGAPPRGCSIAIDEILGDRRGGAA